MLVSKKLFGKISSFALAAAFLSGVSTSCLAGKDKEDTVSTSTAVVVKSQTQLTVDEDNSQITGLNSLDNALLVNIFSNLSGKDLLKVSVASKHLYAAAQHPDLWSPYITQLGWQLPQDLNLCKPMVKTIFSLSSVNWVIKEIVLDKKTLERFVSLEFEFAFESKLKAMVNGDRGYEKEPASAVMLNDERVKLGDVYAFDRTIKGLNNGEFGYSKDLEACKEFIKGQAEKGNVAAKHEEIVGLAYGRYGFTQNKTEAIKLNEVFVAKGDPKAIQMENNGLRSTGNSYVSTITPNRENNDKRVAEGDPNAVERKIYGLADGINGYPKDLDACKEFIEEQVEKGNDMGINAKFTGLGDGWFGFTQNMMELKTFNEELIARGYLKASERKLKGQTVGINGAYGYEKDPELIGKYISALERFNNSQ